MVQRKCVGSVFVCLLLLLLFGCFVFVFFLGGEGGGGGVEGKTEDHSMCAGDDIDSDRDRFT